MSLSDSFSSDKTTNETEMVAVSSFKSDNSQTQNVLINKNLLVKKKEYENILKENKSFTNNLLSESSNNMNSNLTKDTQEIDEEFDLRKGNLKLFFIDKNGKPLIVIGPNCKQNM